MSDAPDIWSAFRADLPRRDTAWRAACLEALRRAGVVDAAYCAAQTGVALGPEEALAAYHDSGWRTGLRPNIAFDPAFYRATYADVGASDQDPLLHYVSYGEAEGRRPVPWFDPAWYRARFAVPASQHALRHYLLHRMSGRVSPIPEFDGAWYLARAPDVAAVGMDPMEHYLLQGFREGRDPSPEFDTRFYRLRYLRGRPDDNPLLHYLAHRGEAGVHARQPADEPGIADEVRLRTAPGPDFETFQPLATTSPRRALLLAFYLPQFHRIAENDAWWGTGFTEWTNVARAVPRFAGHYQPRIPRDLGHYDLADPAVLARQAGLARAAGIGGFVQYFYWFDGRRLLEAPLERMLADPTIDFPFCLMWANENWTRRWDGAEHEVLLWQSYRREDEAALIACFARHFADPRYIRLQGRPLLFVYRAVLIPRARATIARWRAIFRDAHHEDPIIVMAQSFADRDPRRFGCDAAVEFPPHKLTDEAALINDRLDLLDAQFAGKVYDYGAIAADAAKAVASAFPLIRCAVPGWDNDARRQGQGVMLHGATPRAYGRWLDALVAEAARAPVFGTPIVCVNAWNEWAEAAYLEPDVHYGAAFLNATARAVAGAAGDARRLVLVGHDAFAAGAQLLLLAIARQLRRCHGLVLHIVLRGEGDLIASYRECGAVSVLAAGADGAALFGALRAEGFTQALVNSAAVAEECAGLAAAGIGSVLLVHEMAGLIGREGLGPGLAAGFAAARVSVFACETVRASAACVAAIEADRVRLLPQPVYQDLRAAAGSRVKLRLALGVGEAEVLVVALGHGDARKGFDLFLDVATRLAGETGVVLAWAGDIAPEMRAAARARIAAAVGGGRVHLLGFRRDVGPVLRAADALILPSREDPYPSAVLEARALGRPVVAFAGSGGVAEMAAAGGITLVAMEDCAAMAAAVRRLRPEPRVASARAAFGRYAEALLGLARPDLTPVSVVVPCYNQAAYLAPRLESIFAQSMPVQEIVLRDDASGDGSAAKARRVARRAGREIAVVRAAANSGSPFGCWRAAVAAARGELVWIAEADDVAAPAFLSVLVPYFADPAMLFAFTDSRAIGAGGEMRAEDYRESYADAAGPGALPADATYEAGEFARTYLAERNLLFNVSAVLWRRRALHAVLERLGDELAAWRVAGDWRVYIELLTSGAGRVGHVARPLNDHRRSAGSASAAVPGAVHRAEIARMHRLIRARLGDPPGLRQRQERYRALLRRQMG